MATNNLDSILQRFAAEIRSAAREELLDALKHGSTHVGRAAHAATPAASAKGAKRTPDALQRLELQLHAFVSKHPGQRIEQIAKGMNVSTRELNLPVKKLISGKRLTTKGQKRATTYSAR